MKTTRMFLAMMCCIMLTAGFAVADPIQNVDIGIDNKNNLSATGGAATATNTQSQAMTQSEWQTQTAVGGNSNATGGTGGKSDANSDSKSEVNGSGNSQQDAHSSAIVETPRPFLNLQYGTSFINPSTPIPGGEWKLYHSAAYSHFKAAQVERMKRGFLFSDLWPGNWKTHLEISMIGERISGNPAWISVMNYWPHFEINRGDEILAEIHINGDANMPDASFLGMAAAACMEEAGSSRFAIMTKLNFDAVTRGFSISLGGVAGQASGIKGVTGTGGGQIGTNIGSVDERPVFIALCMNNGPVDIYRAPVPQPPPPAPPVVKPEPAPQPAACDPSNIWAQINELKRRIALCTQFCFNNLQLRAALGEKYIDLAVSTGDKRYLNDANKNFEIAERNLKFGKDIKKHRTEASAIMRRVYYLQAGCLNQIYGLQVATDFANKKHLEKFPVAFEQ